jgi:hypothetical protein
MASLMSLKEAGRRLVLISLDKEMPEGDLGIPVYSADETEGSLERVAAGGGRV